MEVGKKKGRIEGQRGMDGGERVGQEITQIAEKSAGCGRRDPSTMRELVRVETRGGTSGVRGADIISLRQ